MNTLALRLRTFLIILLLIMTIGTVGFMALEGLSLGDSLYFSIVTVTTVGYGDISPVTTAGRILSVFLIITGVGTFLGVVANATEMLLNRQEKKMRTEKLNMVISSYFSEAGTKLLTLFAESDPNLDSLGDMLSVSDNWSEADFVSARKAAQKHEFSVDTKNIDQDKLRTFLHENGDFILRLLENPSILEHQSFTNLLRASSHLKEELIFRDGFRNLPQSDFGHIAGDMTRVYSLLVLEWLPYMKYLKKHYPYLYSLALRMSPFNRGRSPVVQ